MTYPDQFLSQLRLINENIDREIRGIQQNLRDRYSFSPQSNPSQIRHPDEINRESDQLPGSIRQIEDEIRQTLADTDITLARWRRLNPDSILGRSRTLSPSLTGFSRDQGIAGLLILEFSQKSQISSILTDEDFKSKYPLLITFLSDFLSRSNSYTKANQNSKQSISNVIYQLIQDVNSKKEDQGFVERLNLLLSDGSTDCIDRRALFLFEIVNFVKNSKNKDELDQLARSLVSNCSPTEHSSGENELYQSIRNQALFEHIKELANNKCDEIKQKNPSFSEDVEVYLNYFRVFNEKLIGAGIDIGLPPLLHQNYYQSYKPSPTELTSFQGSINQETEDQSSKLHKIIAKSIKDANSGFLKEIADCQVFSAYKNQINVIAFNYLDFIGFINSEEQWQISKFISSQRELFLEKKFIEILDQLKNGQVKTELIEDETIILAIDFKQQLNDALQDQNLRTSLPENFIQKIESQSQPVAVESPREEVDEYHRLLQLYIGAISYRAHVEELTEQYQSFADNIEDTDYLSDSRSNSPLGSEVDVDEDHAQSMQSRDSRSSSRMDTDSSEDEFSDTYPGSPSPLRSDCGDDEDCNSHKIRNDYHARVSLFEAVHSQVLVTPASLGPFSNHAIQISSRPESRNFESSQNITQRPSSAPENRGSGSLESRGRSGLEGGI